ncbi:hypothetical protein Agabi119p4_468 [Agaricus bisporus var. burnettii]|uniref:Uncharacterized protein n=1 Tax=Agaricus bisporus var. burnettii TaxID=192524 RepID=A0A8H7FAM9_AGABI|nr:hypothetical protein Agabi119p4_468 [Agaricus bisporus var. burnettii]
MSGPNIRIAYDILVKLFRLCASRGYSYQTNYNVIAVPELVFQPGNCDEGANFFLGYLSNGGRKLTLIKAPDPINVALNPRLRDILPPNVILDLGESGDTQSVEMKKQGGLFGGSQTLSTKLFFMQVLRILGEFGYYLDMALPLYRRGPLGIRLRREILVFKGHVPT